MESSSAKCRLTCILAADAVGYSKQMGQDEEGTIHVLQAHRSVIDGIVAFHHGRIVSTAGGSVLAEFSSAVVVAPAPAVSASVAPAVVPVPSALPKSTVDVKPVKRQADPEPAQANARLRVPVTAPTAAPIAAPPVVPAVAPVAIAADVARFNGRWSVHVDCAKHEDGALGYKMDFVAEAKDGWLRGEAGKPDNPGWLLLQGEIQADGRSVLQAKGLTADPRLSVKGVRQGTPYAYQVDARFDGDQGTGRRLQLRVCLLGFTRQ